MISIIGIDPGSIKTGYGIIQLEHNSTSKLSLKKAGVIKANAKEPYLIRIGYIYQALNNILLEYKPNWVSIEQVFMAKNAKSALILGQARGAIIACCYAHKLEISEYSAREIKQNITGYGSADKEQLSNMVGLILNSKEQFEHDASDAIAAAICHSSQLNSYNS